MKILIPFALLVSVAACSSSPPATRPNLAEQQVLEGARAGADLPPGSETYTDGHRVGGDHDTPN